MRQRLGFCTADLRPWLFYESAVQKPKHCLACSFFTSLANNESVADSSCSDDPPPKPSIGSYLWDGFKSYNTEVTYSCGPYGEFVATNGSRFEEAMSVCQWDGSWSDPGFGECRCRWIQDFLPHGNGCQLLFLGTHCRDIPVAPKSSHFNSKATKASFAHMDIYDGFIICF